MKATTETFVTLKMSVEDAKLLRRFVCGNGFAARRAWSLESSLAITVDEISAITEKVHSALGEALS